MTNRIVLRGLFSNKEKERILVYKIALFGKHRDNLWSNSLNEGTWGKRILKDIKRQ